MTLPATAGATSVCSLPARLPVASKKRGNERVMAGTVVTTTSVVAVVVVVVVDAALVDCAFEPLQAKAPRPRSAMIKVKDKSLRLRGLISSVSSLLRPFGCLAGDGCQACWSAAHRPLLP